MTLKAVANRLGGGSPATFTNVTATGQFLAADGTTALPGYAYSAAPDWGFPRSASGYGIGVDIAGNVIFSFTSTMFTLGSSAALAWGNSTTFNGGILADTTINRAGANSLRFGTTSATTTSRVEINKAVAAIADATPTATFTVTIPNAAHSAMLKVTLVGSLGAGGAIGANEATATISYDIAITRTAGVNAVAAISTAYGSAATAVAGAATVTVTAALSAIAGAVGVANTFTVNVTITKSGGASAAHTCMCYGRLVNANATGITIA